MAAIATGVLRLDALLQFANAATAPSTTPIRRPAALSPAFRLLTPHPYFLARCLYQYIGAEASSRTLTANSPPARLPAGPPHAWPGCIRPGCTVNPGHRGSGSRWMQSSGRASSTLAQHTSQLDGLTLTGGRSSRRRSRANSSSIVSFFGCTICNQATDATAPLQALLSPPHPPPSFYSCTISGNRSSTRRPSSIRWSKAHSFGLGDRYGGAVTPYPPPR